MLSAGLVRNGSGPAKFLQPLYLATGVPLKRFTVWLFLASALMGQSNDAAAPAADDAPAEAVDELAAPHADSSGVNLLGRADRRPARAAATRTCSLI